MGCRCAREERNGCSPQNVVFWESDWLGVQKQTNKKLPRIKFRWPLALTAWSQPVSRTGVSWLLLAGRSKGSSFPRSRLAFVLQRVEKGNDGGPGVRPGHKKTNGNP